jgi:transcriptional regulator NrdR family protein
MITIKKRSGDMQRFDKRKLKDSLVKAGAREEDATKVTETIVRRVRNGMETAEIKRQTANELRGLDKPVAMRYETFDHEKTEVQQLN